MAEIYIRHTNGADLGSPAANSRKTRRGDVIVVRPDGWPWGAKELNSPTHIILRAAGLDVAVAALLVEVGKEDDGSGFAMRKRRYGVDVDSWPPGRRNALQRAIDRAESYLDVPADVVANFIYEHVRVPE